MRPFIPLDKIPEPMLPRTWADRLYRAPVDGAMPTWMSDIVEEECVAHGVAIPDTLGVKRMPWGPWMGGYTQFDTPVWNSEIILAYGYNPPGYQWEGSENEFEAIIHEISHWIVQDRRPSSDGHTPEFYAKLLELSLKHSADWMALEEQEVAYTGPIAFYEGVNMFHTAFNVR